MPRRAFRSAFLSARSSVPVTPLELTKRPPPLCLAAFTYADSFVFVYFPGWSGWTQLSPFPSGEISGRGFDPCCRLTLQRFRASQRKCCLSVSASSYCCWLEFIRLMKPANRTLSRKRSKRVLIPSPGGGRRHILFHCCSV